VAPLHLQKIIIGPSTHMAGLFGVTLTEPLSPESLFNLLEPMMNAKALNMQLVNADFIASPDHLLFATIHALTAFQRGTNRASTLPTEILRFAAAQRQISKALDTLGLDHHTTHIGGVLVHKDASQLRQAYQEFIRVVPCKETPEVLGITSKEKLTGIQKLFEITDIELEATASTTRLSDRQLAVQKLVYDRCALLAISH
jgi:tRNA threonylcarbamoyladenosine modification (KEOPS) complex Cgi121 subunit